MEGTKGSDQYAGSSSPPPQKNKKNYMKQYRKT